MQYIKPKTEIIYFQMPSIMKASITHNGDWSKDDNKDNNNSDIVVDCKKKYIYINLWNYEID